MVQEERPQAAAEEGSRSCARQQGREQGRAAGAVLWADSAACTAGQRGDLAEHQACLLIAHNFNNSISANQLTGQPKTPHEWDRPEGSSRRGRASGLPRAPRGAAPHQLSYLLALAAAQHVHKGQCAGTSAVGRQHIGCVCVCGVGWGG